MTVPDLMQRNSRWGETAAAGQLSPRRDCAADLTWKCRKAAGGFKRQLSSTPVSGGLTFGKHKARACLFRRSFLKKPENGDCAAPLPP